MGTVSELTKTVNAAGGSRALNEGITVRSLHAAEEMRIGVELQQQVWGYSEIDTVPEQMFIVAKESGGQVLVAYEGDRAVGFALAFAGIHGTHHHLHSHMVGVIPEFQNRGVGRVLKLAQRDDAIARGIDLIEWTFDPLQLKNAHFNLARLGAIARRYIPNCYGRTSSKLHAGLPTDRLVAEWWVSSARVQGIIDGQPPVTDSRTHISIPLTIREICANDAAQAESVQSRVREQFEMFFASGYAAVGFKFDEQEGNYLLEPYEN
jgi:predicted GNAT superfamily acetyltransferase